jgi:hypothetical protein
MFHNRILLFVVWLIHDWGLTLDYSEIIVHWIHIVFPGLVKMQLNSFDQLLVSEKESSNILNSEFHFIFTNSGRLGSIID